jgi:hypothetical protein
MKLAIMQPYFFPYLGYFQLAAAADRFVLYDDADFSPGGWINRNRLLDPSSGRPFWITIPVRDAGPRRRIDALAIGGPARWREKLLRRIAASYRQAPHFADAWPVVEHALANREPRLAPFLRAALESTFDYLGIRTPLVESSSLSGDRHLAGPARVIDMALGAGAETYLNAEGGRGLYAEADFAARGLRLQFLEHLERPYPQAGGHPFVPRLSVIDAMMHHPPDALRGFLSDCRLDPPDHPATRHP